MIFGELQCSGHNSCD